MTHADPNTVGDAVAVFAAGAWISLLLGILIAAVLMNRNDRNNGDDEP